MKILVCGIGALGSCLTEYLASDFRDEHEITVLDRDRVEERNVQANTTVYTRDMVGQPKTEALQYILYKMGRKIEILQGDVLEDFFDFRPFDFVIDCFDNHQARKRLQDWWMALTLKKELLHCGFSPNFTWSLLWANGYLVPEDPPKDFDICTLSGSASFVRLVASVGSLVVQDFLKTGEKKEFVGGRLSIREVK